MIRHAKAALLLFSIALSSGCGGSQAPPNIFLVVIDTLRADRLGAYGGPPGLTPFLDALASSGTVYTRAYSTSAWTSPAVASLLTSRLQSQHGIVWFNSVLGPEEVSFVESLHEHGYSTTGITASPILSAELGYDQGFDFFQFVEPKAAEARPFAAQVNSLALRRLDGLDGSAAPPPHFFYLHYMDVHNPYSPRPEDLDFVRDGRARPNLGRVNRAMKRQSSTAFDPVLSQEIRDSYDAAVRSLDARLAEFFGRVRERGLLSNSIIVVTSDHGEEFWEHGELGHNKALYEESIHIPLIVARSGQRSGQISNEVVSLVDVAPTLLHLAGVPLPASFEGRVLGAPLSNPRARAPAVAELWKPPVVRDSPHVRAVIEDDAKLIKSYDGRLEYYDLKTDPAESEPKALGDTRRLSLRERAVWLESLSSRAREQEVAPPLDEVTVDRLRALGYTP